MSAVRYRTRIPTDDDSSASLSTSDKSHEQPSSFKGAIIFATGCICFIIYYLSTNSMNTQPSILQESAAIYAKHHHDGNPETEYMYQFPSGIEPSKANGIIFFAHGCSHSSTDFFAASTKCRHCLGLPEERNLIKFFLKEQFIVISISSQDRRSKCWNTKIDTPVVQDIIIKLKNSQQHNLDDLPVYAFGASSGGAFVGSLATNLKFIEEVALEGSIIQISAINIGDYADFETKVFIPVMFIPMSKDKRTLGIVTKQVEILKEKGNEELKLSTVCEVAEAAIDSFYFYRRIGGSLSPELSKKLHNALKQNGFLNDQDFLIEDPRQSGWRQHLKEVAAPDNLIADQSAISEEMNVAYAMHELAAKCKPQMMKFIKSVEQNALSSS